MGLHYTNEAVGMAATLPSFVPSQPAPFSGEFAPYPVIAYSVFFYSLILVLRRYSLCTCSEMDKAARTFVYMHLGGAHHRGSLMSDRDRCSCAPAPSAKIVLLVLYHGMKTSEERLANRHLKTVQVKEGKKGNSANRKLMDTWILSLMDREGHFGFKFHLLWDSSWAVGDLV